MPCIVLKKPDGSNIFMCGEGLRQKDLVLCSQPGHPPRYADFLCDYPVGEGRTCDLPLCPECAKRVGPDRHFCPVHFAEFARKVGIDDAK